jgi:chorismate mutase
VQVRAIRGAITVDDDRREAIVDATAKVLREMLERNDLGDDDIVSIVFTATDDLRSAFPAEAAREVGLRDIPVLCTRELPVDGALPRVVRVLMHAHTDRPRAEIKHVYLEGARELRKDLS